jgi:hypothetical protein
MTFEQLQALARNAIRAGELAPDWEVLTDVLIEHGRFAVHPADTREELLSEAREWARSNAFRRTGRTTRMLQSAIAKAVAGARVAVLAANQRHAEQLRMALAGLVFDFEILRMIDVHVMGSTSMRGRRYDLVTEDHFTAESREAMLKRSEEE